MAPLAAMTCAGFSGYALLLTVAPLWAVEGGAGTAGSGLVNGVLLLFTVLTQLLVPRSLERFGWGPVLVAGLVLMGVPGILYGLSDGLAAILGLSALRGVGFGILTVTGSAAVAALVDPRRRGEAIGVYGLAVAIPNLVLLPAGPWIAETFGFWWVFGLNALPLAGIPAALRLASTVRARRRRATGRADRRTCRAPPAPAADPAAARRDAGGRSGHHVHATGGRQCVGRRGRPVPDGARGRAQPVAGRGARRPPRRPALRRTHGGPHRGRDGRSGVGGRELRSNGALFLASMLVLGLCYGGLQNLTLLISFAAVSARHHNRASAWWNIGFDAGTALGSVAVGVIAELTSFTTAFLICGAIAATTLPLALRNPRASQP